MKQMSDFFKEMRGMTGEDGGRGEERGKVETVQLELVLLVVVPLF